MGFRDPERKYSSNNTSRWARTYDTFNNRIEGTRLYEPLNITNPEILESVQKELGYIFDLKAVQKGSEFADKISLRLGKTQESKRDLLPHTPRIEIDFIRDGKGNILEKTVAFQRSSTYGSKSCNFIFTQTPEGEIMTTGENTLDEGYNEAIEGWVKDGIRLVRNAIEKDNYTPKVIIDVEYSNGSTIPTEQLTEEDIKGSMEI